MLQFNFPDNLTFNNTIDSAILFEVPYGTHVDGYILTPGGGVWRDTSVDEGLCFVFDLEDKFELSCSVPNIEFECIFTKDGYETQVCHYFCEAGPELPVLEVTTTPNTPVHVDMPEGTVYCFMRRTPPALVLPEQPVPTDGNYYFPTAGEYKIGFYCAGYTNGELRVTVT